MSEEHQSIEQAASAIEDLLYMEAIRIGDQKNTALLSPRFSLIVTNIMSSMKLKDDSDDNIMKLMYFSLLIFMNEHLKLPRALMMAIGNDLEKNRESMESGQIVNSYVAVLTELWKQHRKSQT